MMKPDHETQNTSRYAVCSWFTDAVIMSTWRLLSPWCGRKH